MFLVKRITTTTLIRRSWIWWTKPFLKIKMNVGKRLFHLEMLINNNQIIEFKHLTCSSVAYKFPEKKEKKEHFVTFMKNLIKSDAMEIAPPLDSEQECCYLQPDKIRGVWFFSEVSCSLTKDCLLSRPKFVIYLTGVLLRVSMDAVGIMIDIKLMFYRFFVTKYHRDFLRFEWYRNKDPNKELIEYRMKVYVFGNTPSPA